MTDEKKVITLDEMDPNSMTEEEMELVALRNDVQILQGVVETLKAQMQTLDYQNQTLRDAARMNMAASVLPALVKEFGYDAAIEKAMMMADDLATHYELKMEEKIREYQRRQAEGDGDQPAAEAVN